MPNLNTNGVFTATDSYPILTAFIGKADTAVSTGEIAIWDGTISESLEGEGTEDSPYLIKNGLINRTPRGRVVTDLAYKHLGLEAFV